LLIPSVITPVGIFGSPLTVIRENEFHFSYSGRGLTFPFAQVTRSGEDCLKTRMLFRVSSPASNTLAAIAIRDRRDSPASIANAASKITAVGASVNFREYVLFACLG
jgi:hypothetical protein